MFNRLTALRLGLILVAVQALGLLTGCTVFMMSPDEEVKLGQQLAVQMRPKQQFVTDPAINDYVLGVAHRVWTNSPPSEIQAHFFVIRDPAINAYAIPGGNVYIQTGLVNAASDEAELAAVIAHECGHVICRHGAQQASRQQTAGLFVGVLGMSTSGAAQIAQMAASFGSQGYLAKFSRGEESEADAIGVRTVYRAGYDPDALRTFFVKIQQKYGDGGGAFSQMFASHPPTSDRMNSVGQIVASLPRGRAERPVHDLHLAQARLKALGIQ